jgi:hypothetical protein
MASMAEVPEERLLERFPMFQGKVREVFIKTVNNDIQDIHPLLQLEDPILPLLFHRIAHRGHPRSPSPSTVGVFIPSLFPEFGRGVMSGQEVHGNLVVVSDIGRGVIQVLLHVEGSICLEGRGKIKGGGGRIEQNIVGSVSRHSGGLRGEFLVVIGGSGKETMGGKDQ